MRLGLEPSFHGHQLAARQADLLLAKLPVWEPEVGCDMNYWLHGTRAMRELGGEAWAEWSAALRRTALASQRTEGRHAGSWDPVGPWGALGGRVYSTATMALALRESLR